MFSFNQCRSSSNKLHPQDFSVNFYDVVTNWSCGKFKSAVQPSVHALKTCALKRQKMMGRVCGYRSEAV